MDKVWAIVLAAGKSTRMKRQKLLLPFHGKTIIETVILNILPVLKKILVVLGADYAEIKNQISDLPVKTCLNEKYEEGMLSSVVCGFRALPAEARAVLVFLGDQPQIPADAAKLVLKAWQKSGKGIVIPVTNGKRGHPVLIDTKYKPEIERLDPEKGLRQLMEKFADDVEEAGCYLGEILRDIDTPEEYSTEINLNLNQYGKKGSV